MASPIVVTCPQCEKQIKAPPEAQGKKIRCKGCGHAFVVPAGAAVELDEHAGLKEISAPVKARCAAADEDDDGESNPYGLKEDLETVPRCPHCAKQMERP